MMFYGDRVKIRTYTGQKLMIWDLCSRLERAFNRVSTVTPDSYGREEESEDRQKSLEWATIKASGKEKR